MLFHKNGKYLSGDVVSFIWLNDFKVEFLVFMEHILSKIDTHQ